MCSRAVRIPLRIQFSQFLFRVRRRAACWHLKKLFEICRYVTFPHLEQSFLSKECRYRLRPPSFITQIVRDRFVGQREAKRLLEAHPAKTTQTGPQDIAISLKSLIQPPLREYNLGVRCRLAQIVLLDTAWLLGGQPAIHAQETPATTIPQMQAKTPCAHSSSFDDEQPPGPEISIAEVTFSGVVQMPISDQDQIATSIKQLTHGDSLDGVTEEALDRARAGWQDRGYFKVQVTGDTTTLTSSPPNQRIALIVQVDEGQRYNLGGITFKNNKVIRDTELLRGFFPIKDGDVFSREKIAKGLENLRKAYGDLGYINFVSIPNTNFEDEEKLISLDVDLDEGKQFYIGGVNILGLDEPARQELLKDFPIKRGQIYNTTLWESFLLKHASMFSDCGCPPDRKLDERTGSVSLTLDLRPCPD
jgi:surface antigen-like variable number repeat protein